MESRVFNGRPSPLDKKGTKFKSMAWAKRGEVSELSASQSRGTSAGTQFWLAFKQERLQSASHCPK